MKGPRDRYQEKKGKGPSKPEGGKARARLQQFEQERRGGVASNNEKDDEKKNESCGSDPGG